MMWFCSSQDKHLVAVTGAPPEEELSSKVRDELFRAVTPLRVGLESVLTTVYAYRRGR
jgi:hypothetical protein